MISAVEQPLQGTCMFPDADTRFAGHFPARVVVPGAALVDQAVAEIERATGRRVTTLKQVKFVTAAMPSDLLELLGTASDRQARFELLSAGQTVCTGSVLLAAGN